MRCRLVHRRLLDPREREVANARPFADAVNIPLSELPQRTHELPPRADTIAVAGPADTVQRTIAWLATIDRAAAAADWKFGSSPAPEMGRLWQPTAFLADVLERACGIERLSPPGPGTALDLACGTGRDAVYMASRGWRVTGVDVLPDALERARGLARTCAAAIEPVSWLERDLESGTASFEQRYHLITAFRYLHRPLFPCLRDWLEPGGHVVVETFTTVHRERFGKPARDEFVLKPGELEDLLSGFDTLHYAEGWHDGAHTARAWARKI